MSAAPKKRAGRPSRYSEAIAAEICIRIANGESLRSICRDPHMPTDSVVQEWVRTDSEERSGFSVRYARAREQGYERWAEEILEISNADYRGPDGQTDNGAVQQARLQCDVRRWLLSKLLPRRYGDRVELTGNTDAPVITQIQLVAVSPRLREEEYETARRLPGP